MPSTIACRMLRGTFLRERAGAILDGARSRSPVAHAIDDAGAIATARSANAEA
jgi:hypothetical protein